MIQISTSKKPSTGATFLFPFETKMILMVPIDTSHILARKIRKGIMAYSKISELKKDVSIIAEFC
jgi:hypothetical protein